MNQRGQLMMQKAREGIEGMIVLLLLANFFTPIIAILSPQLLNSEIFPLGGITLFFMQAFIMIITIVFFLRLMSSNPPQQGYPQQNQGW